MSNLEQKKAKLELEYQKRKKRKRVVLATLFSFVVFGLIATIVLTQESVPGFDDKYNIGKSMDYKDKTVVMAEVKAEVGNGLVKIPLNVLEKKGIIQSMYDPNFDIGNGQKGLPVMAYVSPSGRVIVAASFCEPCYSRKFHIENDQLVCDTCGTRWALGDLTGIGGGCVKYPPAELKYTVDKSSGMIVINEPELKNWKPRDYDASSTMGSTN
jgi:uncharacterized protein